MKLINEVINKRLELYNEMLLMHEYQKAVWIFYSLYSICLVLINASDSNIKRKNQLVSKLLLKFDSKTYSKIDKFIQQDFVVVHDALEMLEDIREDAEFFGDKDMEGMIAISQYD